MVHNHLASNMVVSALNFLALSPVPRHVYHPGPAPAPRGLSPETYCALDPRPAGTCEELAGQVAGQATSAGFKVKVANLDSVVRGAAAAAGDVLPKSGAVLIISSTYNGTPPDNAAAFAKWLEEQQEGERGRGGTSVCFSQGGGCGVRQQVMVCTGCSGKN